MSDTLRYAIGVAIIATGGLNAAVIIALMGRNYGRKALAALTNREPLDQATAQGVCLASIIILILAFACAAAWALVR